MATGYFGEREDFKNTYIILLRGITISHDNVSLKKNFVDDDSFLVVNWNSIGTNINKQAIANIFSNAVTDKNIQYILLRHK